MEMLKRKISIEEGEHLHYRGMPTNKSKKNAGIRILLFCNQYVSKCSRQESSLTVPDSKRQKRYED